MADSDPIAPAEFVDAGPPLSPAKAGLLESELERRGRRSSRPPRPPKPPRSGDESRLGVVVADVAGHGIAAALLMATTRAILRSRLVPGEPLAAAIEDTNRSIVADRFSDRFVTLFAAVIDTSDLRLRWVSAGHEPAILYDPATDTFEELGGKDIPLGIRPDWSYREQARDGWRHGQVILIGTDGIWETHDAAGSQFGRDALREVIRANANRPPQGILDAVLYSLARFRGGETQEDDVTLVVLKA